MFYAWLPKPEKIEFTSLANVLIHVHRPIFRSNLNFLSKNYITAHKVLGSIAVSIPACHAGDRGSIPLRGGWNFFLIFIPEKTKILLLFLAREKEDLFLFHFYLNSSLFFFF